MTGAGHSRDARKQAAGGMKYVVFPVSQFIFGADA
jgi:hypothetical protein